MAQLRVAPWLWVAMAFVFVVVVVVVDAAPTTVNKKINQESSDPPLGAVSAADEIDSDVEELHRWGLAGDDDDDDDDEIPHKDYKDGHEEVKRRPAWGSSDTTRDMAEYIFWTGDDKSVVRAVEDLVQHKMLSRKEAASFLEQVRAQMARMQQRYGGALESEGDVEASVSDEDAVDQDVDDLKSLAAAAAAAAAAAIASTTTAPPPPKHQGEIVVTSFRGPADPPAAQVEQPQPAEAVDRAPVEEMVYQLAKILFTQTLHRAGDVESEQSLQKLVDFLEKINSEGKIPPQLQKKILDVLLASLFDAAADQRRGQPATALAKSASANA